MSTFCLITTFLFYGMASKSNKGTLIHLQLTFRAHISHTILNLTHASQLKIIPKDDFLI